MKPQNAVTVEFNLRVLLENLFQSFPPQFHQVFTLVYVCQLDLTVRLTLS